MPEYLFSVMHGDDDAVPEGIDIAQLQADVDRFNTELQKEDRIVFAGGLMDLGESFVADGSKQGDDRVVPGPYNQLDVYQAGMWIIRADGLEQARELAIKASDACHQPIEVRPFQDITE